MGWLGDTFGIFSSATREMSARTLWTGNMIYTALQNARTKKEVRALHQHASESNFQNRAVAILPGISKQQLLLTTSEPDDNDVYDYDTQSNTAALDYIWGEGDSLENVIVSGGLSSNRVSSLIPFIIKAQNADLPIIVLHTGNKDLERMIRNNSRGCEIISAQGCYYDVFRSMPEDDIAYLLYETMKDDKVSPSAESLMRALIEVMQRTEGNVTLSNLADYHLINLKNDIDCMKRNGMLSDSEYDEINHYCLAGSSETDAVRIFLNRLKRQAEAVYGKPGKVNSNIRKILNQKGVIAIDVGSGGNDLLLELVLNHIRLIQSQGKQVTLLFDELPLSTCSNLIGLLRSSSYAISNQDFIASLYGGEISGDSLFSTITGDVSKLVLFRHASGTSCQKWSEHIGQYRKIRIKYDISQSNALMNSNYSRGVSVDETDEPRIRAETLSKLSDGMACIQGPNGVLIAEVIDK